MEPTSITTWPNAKATRSDRPDVSIATVIQEVRSGVYSAQVAALRQTLASGDVTSYKLAKIYLPAFTAAGMFDRRHHSECLLRHSGVLPIDIDNVPDLIGLKARLVGDAYIYYCFVSPSGAGLKLGVRIDPANHLGGYFASEVYFKTTYDVTIDQSCKDICRLTFVSHDPDAWLNPGAVQLPLTDSAKATADAYLKSTKPSKKKQFNPDTTPKTLPLKAVEVTEDVEPVVLQWLLRSCVATDLGCNNHLLHRLARRCLGLRTPITAAQRMTVFNSWHTASQTSGQDGSSVLQDSYDDYSAKFAYAFQDGKVKLVCRDVIGEEWAAISSANGNYPMPAEAAKYTDPKWKHSVALAHRLAVRNGDRPFILSCADLSRVLNVAKDTAGNILNGLLRDDILRLVMAHTEFKARRFAYNSK